VGGVVFCWFSTEAISGESKQASQSAYETNPSSRQRGCYIMTITARVQLEKNSGRASQGAWRQN
jgi:hypothetical protein